jgi:hypothetical protein
MSCPQLWKIYFAVALVAVLFAALPVEAKSPPCACPRSIGAAAGALPLVVLEPRRGRPGLVACGYLETRKADNAVLASEFEVFQCGSSKPIFTFGALQHCEIAAKRGRLVVTELTRWPFGPGWEWIDLPFREYVITPGRRPRVSKILVLQRPGLTPQQVGEVLARFERQKKSKTSLDYAEEEDLVGRILVAALSGNPAARAAFEHIDDAVILDGALGEEYAEALKVYNAWGKTEGWAPIKVPWER